MAMKKIRLDFSKTEERSGYNSRQMPEGIHKMRVDAVVESDANDGTNMLVFALVPEDSRYKSRRFPYYCKLQPNQMWKIRDLLVAAGQTVPKRIVNIDPSVIVGKYVAAEVEDDNYQGNPRSSVAGTYGLDILDEGGSVASDDEDDEEAEYEDDADEAEEEETEQDDEEEEESELDLSTATLPELRAAAKAAGIDTAGLKKADLIAALEDGDDDEEDEDEEELEDDLDEEELYDDEDDDEEEEEEPAPAPRRKAAAKPAAKAAPAKRVVRRR